MRSIEIRMTSITDLDTDAVVNAANSGLREGGGVCGAIFQAAGREELRRACERIGHCDTGAAVITPGFRMKTKYIIHAVGPRWTGGSRGEAELLRSAYQSALRLAEENGCRSIGFPLLSAGIFGYPLRSAWTEAVSACAGFLDADPEREIHIVFAVLEESVLEMGMEVLKERAGFLIEP